MLGGKRLANNYIVLLPIAGTLPPDRWTHMDSIMIVAIAVGLAMDAFSVAIGAGMVIGKVKFGHYLRLASAFGFFQFMMPILGYFAGVFAESFIGGYDHWVAMALLAYIGVRMIKESYSAEGKGSSVDPSRGQILLILSVATSIDALAVGVSIGVLRGSIVLPSIVIGLVCALFSAVGIRVGKVAGSLLGRRVERIGGLILIGIGVKIVLEHIL